MFTFNEMEGKLMYALLKVVPVEQCIETNFSR
jgi:hypothetical protein